MSQTIAFENFSQLNLLESTELNADVEAADTTIAVRSSDNLEATNFLYLGRLGTDGGEKVVIDSVTDETTLALDGLGATKPHSQFDHVYRLFGDKIKVYYASNVNGTPPADDDFSELVTIDIDFDDVQTTYTHADGSDDYWYKYTFYNSVSTDESDITATTAVRGGNVGNYCSITAIRREAGLLTNRNITDAFIDEKRQAAQALINSKLAGRYLVPFESPINPLVQQMTYTLAAGYLLIHNYGPIATLNTNNGQAKIDWVINDQGTGVLDKLDKGELKLIGVDGVISEASSAEGEVTSWPNADTATATPDVGGGERMFRVSDREGYGTRLY